MLIDHAGARGGAERFVCALAAQLAHERFEVCVCSTRSGEPAAVRELARAGVRHVELGRTSAWQVHRLGGLASLIRQERFDVLHAHKFGSNLWGTLAGRAGRVPVVLAQEHNWSYSGDRLRAMLDGLLIARLASAFVAVSEANRERMIELEGVPAAKIRVLPTAYVPSSAAGAVEIRDELGLPAGTPLIGVAAALREEKALDVLIDAHALLIERVPGAHLVIAGDGPCRAALERQIVALGVAGSVHLLGWREDVDAILGACDAGALSSDWEGLPLFVFECMAAHLPLVATAVGGLAEVVRDGSTGLLVAPRDPAALAGALIRVLEDRAYAAGLAAGAAARLDEFTIEAVAARFGALYEELAVPLQRPPR
jgi:glycosyltransferase involved in cell wall biosynthesis